MTQGGNQPFHLGTATARPVHELCDILPGLTHLGRLFKRQQLLFELEKFLLSQLEKRLSAAQMPDPGLQAAIPSPLILPRPLASCNDSLFPEQLRAAPFLIT